MARGKALTELDDTDLIERLTETKQEYFNLRFQFATGQLESPARLRHARRDVARVLTELRAREIAAAEAEYEHTTSDSAEGVGHG